MKQCEVGIESALSNLVDRHSSQLKQEVLKLETVEEESKQQETETEVRTDSLVPVQMVEMKKSNPGIKSSREAVLEPA